MKNYKLHISDGFKDITGNEILIKKELESRVVHSFRSFGYELIKTPGLEYVDIYSHDGLQKPDLYNLINRQGEVLALTNDMTSSIARYVASNNTLNGTLKYCYSAPIYRYPRLYQGKDHEFLQAGVELLGESGLMSDAGIIYLAYRTLKACNIKDFTISLGSSKFLKVLLDDFGIDAKTQELIYATIESKDYVSLRHVLDENTNQEISDFIIDLMMRGGKLKFIEKLIKSLDDKRSSCMEASYLKDLYMSLHEMGVDNVIFDFSIYSYAKYYTGIVFNVYIEDVTRSVISGGRCDELLKEFGKDMPNIGFGVDIDALTDYVLENNVIDMKEEKYLSFQKPIHFVRATLNNEKLREQGIIVNQMSFYTLNDALEYAKANGYDKVIEYTTNGYNLKEVE